MTIDEILDMPAHAQARLISAKEVSPVELCRANLDRIHALDGRIGAFITVADEQALAAAAGAEKRAAAGALRSPLDGVLIGVKDIEATSGIRTTVGSRYFENTVPDFDSVVVERIRAAGMVIIGKTNTPEIAIHMGTVTDNDVRGPCRNPWDTERTTAGSSGGSAAALAADMCQVAIGSDGGGSIRIPASFCGVFGLKPSNGRVPRARGLGRPDPNQFSQSGPMTNDVTDAALLLQVISGPHPEDPQPFIRSAPPDFSAELDDGLGGLRIGYSPDLGYGAVAADVRERFEATVSGFRESGADVAHCAIRLGYEFADSFWKVFGANASVQYGHMLDERPELLTEGVRQVLADGRAITGGEYASALRHVNELRQLLAAEFERFDVLVTPTTSVTAFRPGERPTKIGNVRVDSAYGVFPFTYIFNMSGHPAASIPCGFASGLPVGLQVIGRHEQEATVLRVAKAVESIQPWRGTRPPI